MTMEDFLAQLDAQLYVLTPEERESAVAYYREYLEEAGTNVRAAINALGSPQSVAQRILREIDENRVVYDGGSSSAQYAYADPLMEYKPASSAKSPSGGRIALTVLVLLLSSPIWITLFSLWLTVLVTLGAIDAGFLALTVAAPIHGMTAFFSGNAGEGIWSIGIGVTSLGLLLLTWKPFWQVGKHMTLGLLRLCKGCISGLLGKDE